MNKNTIKTCGLILAGSVIYGIGTHCFVSPANIAPGGASGIAIMLNYISGAPIGTMTLMVNIPLLLLAWFYVSRDFVLKTAAACVASALILDGIIAPLMPVYTGDRLLSSLFGGILVGVGMTLIFMSGSTTGGSDVVGRLLQKKAPHISMGRALMMIDGVVLLISISVFKNIESGLFGLLCLFAQTQVIDSILYGVDKGSLVTVVSCHAAQMGKQIITDLDRSATIIDGKGAYNEQNTNILLCAVRKQQFSRLKSIIHTVDPQAFVMVSEVSQVFGLGFKDISEIN